MDSDHVASHQVETVPGAIDYLRQLNLREDMALGMAAGGWRESAEMKLRSAGIDLTGIPISSANDNETRTGMMQHALDSLSGNDSNGGKVCYFGDGIWDGDAWEKIRSHFILVGRKFEWQYQIDDYLDVTALNAILDQLHAANQTS